MSCNNVFESIWKSLYVLYDFVFRCISNFSSILKPMMPFTIIFSYCIYFVIQNEGIAMGDKGAHEVALHFTQPMYFLLLFCLVQPLHSLRSILYFRNELGIITLTTGIIMSVIFGLLIEFYT